MVTATTAAAHSGGWRAFWRRVWQNFRKVPFCTRVLDLFYTLWVVRAPFAGVVVGTALLLVPQSEDLFVQLATGSWWRIIQFFLLLFVVWAATTHYGARLLVTSDERYAQWLAGRPALYRNRLRTWSPRLLGLVPFAAVLGSIIWSAKILPRVHEKDVTADATFWLTVLGVITAAVGLLFLAYVCWRSSIAATRSVNRAEALAGRIMGWVRLFPRITATPRAGASDLGPLILILMFAGFTVGAFFLPLSFAEWFPRAAAVPFIVGGWLPLLVYWSGLGRRGRVPLILLAFAFTWTASALRGDYFIVRPFEPATPLSKPAAVSRLPLKEALKLWRTANREPCASDPAACPRPIVIAASGGASRAGFFTASVIGQLLDNEFKVDNRSHGLSPDVMRNRIFAISSVSGSSVGAVMAVAAMGAAKSAAQPCREEEGGAPLWHADPKPIKSWRSCFEALMSGDFLTPTLTGFVFRDMLRFVHWSDRAELLERSWEKQFARLIDTGAAGADACGKGLECPFLGLRPTEAAAGGGRWLPLLVINGHSVGTGQRIMTSVLHPKYAPDGRPCPLTPRVEGDCQIFAEAYDFYDLARGSDVRLSTGAHNSARFPIISPPGEIRGAERKGKIADRIVDGGYFENSGAQSALDLVQAIRTVEPKLAPFVLVLTNDPELPVQKQGETAQPVIQLDKEGSWLTDISATIKALLHSRDGRGTLAIKDVHAAVDRAFPGCAANFAHIRVWAEPVEPKQPPPGKKPDEERKARPLSMSWWLSKPVQLYMHEQTEFVGDTPGDAPKDRHENRGDMDRMLKGINNEPRCVAPETR